jgi:protein-tyrosine kinase
MSAVYKALMKGEREREKVDSPPELKSPPVDGKGDESSGIIFLGPEAVVSGPIRKALEGPKTRPGKLNPFLVTLFEPGSIVAEQFRKLKAKIHRLNASGSLKTIMITSSTNGEGKSFIAANLGVSLAREIHNRVLMIDCDLRNPTLTKYFGIGNGRGLSEYLQGKGELREFVKETGIERLRILPAGMAENAPADLIASNKMKALLGELKSQPETQFIIIDSTPLLATTEPEVLAALVDGIILVVRAGVTPRETVEQAMASLENEKILGAVLNELVFKTPGLRSSYFGTNGHYYKYGYGYGYGNREMKVKENREMKVEEDKGKIARFERFRNGNGRHRKRR